MFLKSRYDVSIQSSVTQVTPLSHSLEEVGNDVTQSKMRRGRRRKNIFILKKFGKQKIFKSEGIVFWSKCVLTNNYPVLNHEHELYKKNKFFYLNDMFCTKLDISLDGRCFVPENHDKRNQQLKFEFWDVNKLFNVELKVVSSNLATSYLFLSF